MIQTLYARAQESRKPEGKIRDEMAVEIVNKMDYDFSEAEKDRAMSSGVIARTLVLDKLAGRFISKNPNAVA